MKPYIEFKKQRELGDILSDTFAFIRNEFKPFFKVLISVAGPYIVLFLVAMVFYMYIVGSSFTIDLSKAFPYKNPAVFFLAMALYLIAAILAYVFTTSTTLHYIKSYIDNRGEVNINEVKTQVNDTFWPFLGVSFLKGLTVIMAVMICCLPVFYVIVPMTIVLPLMVFKNMGGNAAFGDSFPFIKEQFWPSLGAIIVLYIIVTIIGSIFAVPSSIYTWIKMGVFSGEVDPGNLNTLIDPIYIFLNVLSSVFQYLLNILIVIGSAIIYFNINERKHFTGTLEKINAIGDKRLE